MTDAKPHNFYALSIRKELFFQLNHTTPIRMHADESQDKIPWRG
jgi:hypothetical protein